MALPRCLFLTMSWLVIVPTLRLVRLRVRAHRHIQVAGRIAIAGVGLLGVGVGARHQAGMVTTITITTTG